MVGSGVFPKDDGDTFFHVDANLIPRPQSNMDAADNLAGSVEVTVSASASYTTIRTLDIGPGSVTSFVVVRFNIRGTANSPNQFGTRALIGSAQITIDGTTKFEKIIPSLAFFSLAEAPANNSGGVPGAAFRSYVYKYSPSAGEMASGFTIDLDLGGSVTTPGNEATADVVINEAWEVWGA